MIRTLFFGKTAWALVTPLIGMGVFLLALGGFAAWNVHRQQQETSELVAREVHGLLAIVELHGSMREIRYQINLFLRTDDPKYLAEAVSLHTTTNAQLARAKGFARTPREQELIRLVEQGYGAFFDEFDNCAGAILTRATESHAADAAQKTPHFTVEPAESLALTDLSDRRLTHQVLTPLHECLTVNQQVVDRTNEANQATAQHLKIGFVLLGICGAMSGLLTGIAIARSLGSSIVQLDVSVRSVAGQLSNVTRPVTFTHTGELAGIETGLKTIEQDIAEVVERLQQRETELLRSEQLARVGQLAAGMAHELRNPLMPMKMLVQAAMEGGEAACLRGRSLAVIREEIERLERSIHNFLEFARPTSPEVATIDIREIIRTTLALVSGRVQHQAVNILLCLTDEASEIRADRTQIRQLLLNLLLNSLDALPEEGTIEIVTQLRQTPIGAAIEMTEHDAMRMLGERPKTRRWLAIIVADDGPGIPRELLANIFDPFVTTKETGTGLGLSICRRIATAHAGELTVANRAPRGAEFTLLLPLDS